MTATMTKSAFEQRQPLYETVANALRNDILAHGRRPRRLPTEGELCRAHGVSHITLRKAMGILKAEGLIVRTPRRGTFVAPDEGGLPRTIAGLSVAINIAAAPGTGNFLSLQMLGASEALGARDAHLVVKEDPRRPENAAEFVQGLIRGRMAGLLCYSYEHETSRVMAEEALGADLPVVLLGDRFDGSAADYVTTDNVTGGMIAADHLLSLGHRRIAFVGAAEHPTQRDRWLGMRERVVQAGGEAQCYAHWQNESAPPMERFLEGRGGCTAVFCGNDSLASLLLRELLRLGVRVPGELSVMGYDNSVEYCEHAGVPLTSVAQPAREIGARAAQFLLERISRQPVAGPRRVQLAPRLVIRASAARTE